MANEDAVFNWASEPDGATISDKNVHTDVLSLNGVVQNGQLSFNCKCAEGQFEASAIEQFCVTYKQTILACIEHCQQAAIAKATFQKAKSVLTQEDDYSKLDGIEI